MGGRDAPAPDDAGGGDPGVLATDDPVILRRYLELHGERLQERVQDQQRALGSLERSLTEAILQRSGQERIGARTSV